MLFQLLVAAAVAGPAAPITDPVTWMIDPIHSEVTFRVRHFVTKVPGTFKDWAGTIVADPDNLAGGQVEVTVKTASVDTKNDRRDTHLRSNDFFAVDSFPDMTFKSTRVEVTGSDLKVTGDLTIRGVTKSVVLTGEYGGTYGQPAPKQQRIGFTATTRVNRLDFGRKWNRLVEGSNMLGDDVDITINVEAIRQ
ncbi:MAG: YceI family protein [Gemmatimonadales bacterium]